MKNIKLEYLNNNRFYELYYIMNKNTRTWVCEIQKNILYRYNKKTLKFLLKKYKKHIDKQKQNAIIDLTKEKRVWELIKKFVTT